MEKEKPFGLKRMLQNDSVKAAQMGRFFFTPKRTNLQSQMTFNRPTYTLEEALKKAENYCAYQERCHQEVRQKLIEMRMIPEAIDHILGHLIAEGYLNEGRFTEQFVLGKFRHKGWGKNRLRQELKQRDISGLAIDRALREIDLEEYQATFHQWVEKLWRQSTGKPQANRLQKLRDGLRYRGWEPEWIYEALGDKMKS
jgi:regulatory protein